MHHQINLTVSGYDVKMNKYQNESKISFVYAINSSEMTFDS